MTVYLLNSAVLTEFGEYEYSRISVEDARKILENGFVSAVGHKSIAEFISNILGVKARFSRIEIRMLPGDIAVVYKIAVRLPNPNAELKLEDLEKIPYDIGVLVRKR